MSFRFGFRKSFGLVWSIRRIASWTTSEAVSWSRPKRVMRYLLAECRCFRRLSRVLAVMIGPSERENPKIDPERRTIRNAGRGRGGIGGEGHLGTRGTWGYGPSQGQPGHRVTEAP